jgi:DNA polymerase-1
VRLAPLNKIPTGDLVAFDTETTGLNPWKGDRPFCISFCNRKGEQGYIRWPVNPFTREVIPEIFTYNMLKEWAEDPFIAKIGHNLKFDVRMLDMIGIKVKGKLHETMFMLHCLNNVEPTLELKPVTKRYLGIPTDDEEDLHSATCSARRQGKKLGWRLAADVQADYWMAPDSVCRKYNLRDSERTMLLYLLLDSKLDKEGVRKVYEDELRLWPVTYEMESRGVRVYPKIMKRYMDENELVIMDTMDKMRKMAPEIDNFNSPDQLKKYFYQTCKIECKDFTDKGNPSLDTNVLLKLDHPLARLIIEHRGADKARTTFFGKFYELMVKEKFNGKVIHVIHPNFNQIGPATGRYSCRNPNLQNVADPLAGNHPVKIPARRSFGPRPGYRWYHFDYKQMEMWEFFSPVISNDTEMLKFMLSGGDVPDRLAQNMGQQRELDEDHKKGVKYTRVRMKIMFYGIIYGEGVAGLFDSINKYLTLAGMDNITEQQARDLLYKFKESNPKIDSYMRSMTREVESRGFVRGPLGRKFRVKEGKGYSIVNYLVQGSGAQALKRAMCDVSDFFKKENLDAHLILTVHDEIGIEIKEGQDNKLVLRKVKKIIESQGASFQLPKLPVDIERVDKYWADKVEIYV